MTDALPVATDTNILDRFWNLGQMDLLVDNPRWEILVPRMVKLEAERRLQGFNAFCDRPEIQVVSVTGEAVELYTHLVEDVMDAGEAACTAYAAHEELCLVATDEVPPTPEQIREHIPNEHFLESRDFLVSAERQDLIDTSRRRQIAQPWDHDLSDERAEYIKKQLAELP